MADKEAQPENQSVKLVTRMREEIEQKIKAICKDLYGSEPVVELTRPEMSFGDYSCNVALKLAAQLEKSPRDIGQEIADKLRENPGEYITEVNVAGPGFINIRLSQQALVKEVKTAVSKSYENQQIITEFGDANPFKEMHLGHLYTAVVGDTIARLFEVSGAKVMRVSYHGDIGLHIAKAIWAIQKALQASNEQDVKVVLSEPAAIGKYYAEGAKAYDEDEQAKAEIRHINASIYSQDNPEINEIYQKGKVVSFANFDTIFEQLDIKFVKRYLESESSDIGLKVVRDNIPKVFEESDGAVIYKGERVGLHTRVFINSQGLPTYETKDLGLAELKDKDFPEASKSIIITDHQQAEYFKVMLAALSEINNKLAAKTQHLFHGHLGLSTGKMSSRTGSVFAAQDLIDDVMATIDSTFPDSKVKHEVYLAALRYSFLKSRLGADIVFDVKQSVALEGNSGPYLQYSHARARSIIERSGTQPLDISSVTKLEGDELSMVRKLAEFSEVVDKAVYELLPHYICTYLYELAQSFNRFYESNRVVGDARQSERLSLVSAYADTLRAGLNTLGIPAPDKM